MNKRFELTQNSPLNTSKTEHSTLFARVPSQFVLKSTRTQVNSFSFWSIRTHRLGQFVLIWSIRTHCLVNSYSFWLIRPHFGQLVLMFFGQFVLILGNI